MAKHRKKRSTIFENKKIMMSLFIAFIAFIAFACISTLVYWAPQIGRTSAIIDQNNYTTGKFIEKTHNYVPTFGKYNSTRESVVSYTIDGQNLSVETFVWSPRPGRTMLLYVDKNDVHQAVTKAHREQAIVQTSLASFIVLVGLGLNAYIFIVNTKRK